MKTQEQLLRDALALSVANPTLPIHICAASDELDEDSPWTMHKIEDVKICPWFERDERIYTELDKIFDQMEDDICGEYSDLDDLKKIIDRRISEEVTQAICIFTKSG